MKDKTFKWVTRFFIATGIIYWVMLILAATTGCTTLQSDVINLKEPISTGGDWIMQRKDFKVSERNSIEDIDERLRALNKESKKYKNPNETIIHLDEPLGARDYWEREEFLQHFD